MMNEALVELSRKRKLILGSGSPRRVKILTDAGIDFRQVITHIPEIRNPEELPYDFAERMARGKATAAANLVEQDAIVLGCDTVVVLDEQVLGKPQDESEAFTTLSLLSGREHVVCTALALYNFNKGILSGREMTTVHFNQVSEDQIRKYIASGEPLDKAGAYGIQGMGSFLVDSIEGNLDNVIGLPGKLLNNLAKAVLQDL